MRQGVPQCVAKAVITCEGRGVGRVCSCRQIVGHALLESNSQVIYEAVSLQQIRDAKAKL